MPKFEVQQYTFCGGWTNTWTEFIDEYDDEAPMFFDSYDEAEEELDQHILDCQKEYERGNISAPYGYDEFRIVEVL